jgi:hypothetical protein
MKVTDIILAFINAVSVNIRRKDSGKQCLPQINADKCGCEGDR